MAAGKITLSYTTKTNAATSATVTITMKYTGNGETYNLAPSSGNCTITLNGTTKFFTGAYDTDDSNKTLGSAQFTINKTHAAQSLTATGTIKNYSTVYSNPTGSCKVSIAAKTSYTVSYAANGGSGTTTAQTKWYNESLTLRGALTRSGYGFSKWKATNGTLYNASASYTANAATTMTAQWTGNTYYVKFNANGGSGAMANQTFTYGAAQKALTRNTFTRTGYIFNGWKTAVSSGTSYTDGQSVSNLTTTANATINLYAQWTPIIYTITLNNQSATSEGTATYYEKYATGIYSNSTATTAITSITVPSKDGYRFGGYYTATNGDGVQYIDSSGQITATNTTFTKDTTLYALWIEAYIPPKITNVRIVRCTESGTETLSGDHAKLSFNWTAGIAQDGTVNNNTNISIVATINDDSENGTEIEHNETGLTEESGAIENNISPSSIPYSNPGSIVITILDVTENQSSSITVYIPEGGFPIHISQKENNITLFGTCDEDKQGLIVNSDTQIQGKASFYNGENKIRLEMVPATKESAVFFTATSQENIDLPLRRVLYSTAGNFGICGPYTDNNNNWLFRIDTSDQVFFPEDKVIIGNEKVTTKDIKMITSGRQVNISLNANKNFGFYDVTLSKWIFNVTPEGNIGIPEGRLVAPKSIVHGSVTITPSAANTPTSKAVTWPAMAGVPHIALGAYTSLPGTQVTGVAFSYPSATGCQIFVTRTNTGAFATHYIAIY